MRRPQLVIESLEFDYGDDWRGRPVDEHLMVFSGPSAAGKSTPMEALLYALGLVSGTIMPEVKERKAVRLVFKAGNQRWSATRTGTGRSARVVFDNLTTPGIPITRLVRPGKPSEESASDVTLGLLGIPVLKSGDLKLDLDLVRSVFTTRQEFVATRFLNALTTKERRLTLDVLLGLRDEELDRLESTFSKAEREYGDIRSTINRYVKARQNAGLDSDTDVRRERDRKKREHADVNAEREKAQQALSDLESDQARFEREEQQAYQSYRQARSALDEEQQRCQQAAQALGVAEGYLQALLQQIHDDGRCPRCTLGLPQRRPGHCTLCDQLLQDAEAESSPQWDELVEVARQGVRVAQRQLADRTRQVDELNAVVHKAQLVLDEARVQAAAHRERTAPARARVRALEKRADTLTGELEQLTKRIKEQGVLASLRRDLEQRGRLLQDARRLRDAARGQRQQRRTDLLARLAQLVLIRLQAVLPAVQEVAIDPEDYSLTIDGKPFADTSVAGGPKTAANVAFLLALQDLAAEEPDVLVPPLLVIDAPLSGFSSRGADEGTSRRLLEQLVSAAEPDVDGSAVQVVLAVNDRIPQQRTTATGHLALSAEHRFFDHAPACPRP
ncbi:AAA family ATPase [Streptomyces sp. NPDC102340]|uniref:AAA family ATPase n=1 Tax=unclassified Streptomyces TaxID=2593676 RepID=UPI0037F32AD1